MGPQLTHGWSRRASYLRSDPLRRTTQIGTTVSVHPLENARGRGWRRTTPLHQDRLEIRSRLDLLRERRTVGAAGCARSAHRRRTVPSVGRRAHDFTLWRLLRTATAARRGPTRCDCVAGTNGPVRQRAAWAIRHRQRSRRSRSHIHDHRNRSRWARRSRYTTGVGTVRGGGRMGCSSLVDRATSSNTQCRPVGKPRISTSRSNSRTRSRTARIRSGGCSRTCVGVGL